MTDVVVDNSALIEMVAGHPQDRSLLRRLATSSGRAPEIIDAEAVSTLRKMMLRGRPTDEQATAALNLAVEAPIRRISHRPLVAAAWRLRHAVSAFDALYLALAQRLDAPLITCDARLAGSNGHGAKVELYSAS